MLETIKKILGLGPSTDYSALVKRGAQIVDVRTAREYATGHIRSSVNIPLDQLQSGAAKLRKDKPVITCCASGMRSASAKALLRSNGFSEVYNGGGWAVLKSNLKQ